MQVPARFGEGFGIKTTAGAMFLGLAMIPGSIYLALMMGVGLGPAAQWVTIILFAEVAKRSMKSLEQQEVFLIFYMTGIAIGGMGHGGIITQFLWAQYLSQSTELVGMGIEVPEFYAAPADAINADGRTFFTRSWVPPIFFVFGLLVIQRLDAFGLGYALYCWTSRIEKLPFPMAPAEGLGITALVDTKDPKERWKKRCFSLGAMLGLMFGFVYVGIPAITGAFFANAVQVIPIPWLDLTPTVSTKEFLPAMPLNLMFDISLVLAGMVLPFWAVVGGFIGLLITLVLNPMLYKNGVLTTWTPGQNLIDTMFSNHVDFYLSFGIGLALAIFLISMGQIARTMFLRHSAENGDDTRHDGVASPGLFATLFHRDPDRGGMPMIFAILLYIASTTTYVSVCVMLMPGDPQTGFGQFPWLFFLVFAFIYQPIMSYVSAKLEGLVGQTVQIPLVREATYILSGYNGSTIWFAPIPVNDYNQAVRRFRVMELTGTKLTSVIKTELLVIPIVLISTLVFSDVIWRLAPVPSAAYPFANEFWRLQALNFSLTATATMDGSSPFMEAIKADVIGWGALSGVAAYAVLAFLGLPTFLIYGVVRGLGQSTPGNVIPEMIGALLGRIYLQKKFGHQLYKKYIMVVFSGFIAGMGLIGMASVAIALIAKSTSTLRY